MMFKDTVEVALRMPVETLKELRKISKLANVTAEQAINVILALTLAQRGKK